MAQGNVPAPYSIYKNIFKIVPGTYLEVNTPDNYRSMNIGIRATLQPYPATVFIKIMISLRIFF